MGEASLLLRIRWFINGWLASLTCRRRRSCTDQNRWSWPFQCALCPLNRDEFDSANGFDAQEDDRG